MYRTIDTAFWTDPKVRAVTAEARALMLYLITNSHAHVGGIYHVADVTISHETGYPIDTLSRLWTELDRVGLCRREAETEVVWVVQMLKRQGKGIKIDRSVANQLKGLHNSSLIKSYIEHYPRLKRYFGNRVSMGHPAQDGSGIQEQEQEQEQNTSSLGEAAAEAFEDLSDGTDTIVNTSATAAFQPDELGTRIRQKFGELSGVIYDAKTAAKARQLVDAVGWDRAWELVDDGVGKRMAFPVGWALSVGAAEASGSRARAAKRRSVAKQPPSPPPHQLPNTTAHGEM